MRPLELTIDGFKSYRDPQTFNFDGRGLFGIVGPTGSGKSSLLDAMVYALFGKTPRLEKETRRLINSQCDEAKVRLVFDVDDVAWEVTRVIRHKGAAPVVLRKLGETNHEAAGAGAVSERIESLIGLDFRAFCSSVTLPQGEFDRFLRAAPSDRAKVLKGIFRLERVDQLRELAKQRKAELEGTLVGLQTALSVLPEDPKGLLIELSEQLKDTRAKSETLKEAIEEEAKTQKTLETVTSNLEVVEKRRVSTEEALERLPEPSILQELAEAEDALVRSFEAAAKEASALAKDLQAAIKGEADLNKSLDADSIPRAKELAFELKKMSEEVSEARARLAKLDEQTAEHQKTVAAAERSSEKAAEVLRLAEADLLTAHRTHDAHRLQKGLKPGDDCPVCGQTVGKITMEAAPGLDVAEKAKEKADRKAKEASASLEQAGRALALIENDSVSVRKRIEDLEASSAGVRSGLDQILGSPKDAETEIEKREGALRKAALAVSEARQAAEESSRNEREMVTALEASRKLRLSHVEILIKVSERLALEAPTFEDDAAALLDSAKRAEDAGRALLKELTSEKSALEAEIVACERRRSEFHQRLGLADGESVAEALSAVTERIGALQSEMTKVTEAAERRTELEKEMGGLIETRAHLEILVSDLTDSRFPAYLLDGHRRLLSELGSEKLFGLTGRYRFDDAGEFQIVDEATGVTRSPETLSGGETFLASLALALAMAEAVAQQGGRLDCFFLDEGFGSLDSGSLELALDGIESLAVPGRLIGLISHVGGLQSRLDDLIVLDRKSDGSTQVEQTEGPIAFALTI
ncbi:MAG: SMC family ATPase [Actinobacteria bacterium]|nr:SMC family ATPase [Actinomycetota bacterium]